MSTPLPLVTDPQDVALDLDPNSPNFGDILIDADGLHLVAGVPAVTQAIRFKLLLALGEWFLDTTVGTDFDQILGDASKVPGVEGRAKAIALARILSVPAVVEVPTITVVRDRVTRRMSISAVAQTLFGDTPAISVETP
jgi:hypothetical protein